MGNEDLSLPPEMPDTSDPEQQKSLLLEKYKAELAVWIARVQADLNREIETVKANAARAAATFEKHSVTYQEVYKGYIEVAKGKIDRSLTRADFVQKVAAAVGTAYVGILALTFSVTGTAKSLPVSGLAPVIFIGFAFFLSAAYVAYLPEPLNVKADPTDGTLVNTDNSRRNTFIKWTRSAVLQGKYMLRSSVLHLGISLFFLPAPYLGPEFQEVLWFLVAAGLLIAFFGPFLIEKIQLACRA